MWQIDNRTPFAAGQGWVRNLEGAETWLVVVKASFDVFADGATGVCATQPPVARSAVYAGQPGSSSIICENDFVLAKTTTDIVVNGAAHAPGGKPAASVDVGFRVGELRKVLRVFGDRCWRAMGALMTDPAPFTTMPLTYERAFGGIDLLSPHPETDWYWANPAGTGFAVARGHLANVRLPNVEYPGELIDAWDARPAPAGFGVIGPNWQPRAALAGTYGPAWQQARMPLLPDDFDMRHYQVVPGDQQAAAFLTGGEPVALLNLTPAGMSRFALPLVELAFVTHFLDGERREHFPNLHTVIIEPELSRVSLVWHSAIECHQKAYQLDRTRIAFRSALRTPHEEEVEALFGLD